MRKYFCDRCGNEIDFEALDKCRNSNECPYDICIDAWDHGIHGSHFHSPMELCADCVKKLNEVVAKFMKEGNCSK